MKLEDNIIKMEEQIDKLKSEIASMKAKLKQQDKLELKGGNGYYIDSTLYIGTCTVSKGQEILKRGAFRATKQLAEIANRDMVTRNRLEAYVHQIQGDGEGRWLIYTCEDGTYKKSNHKHYRPSLGTVYMQEETVEILVSNLNDGTIVL